MKTINDPAFSEISDRAYQNGYEFGKAEAIERCAQVADDLALNARPNRKNAYESAAAAIRALKDQVSST
jgi:hypothetical protein